MNIVQSKQNGVSLFALKGRLDATSTSALDTAFTTAFDAGDRKFVWDCSDLAYISSAGLRAFLQAMKKLDASGGRLVIAAARPSVVEVFDISGFKALMALRPDVPSALAEVGLS